MQMKRRGFFRALFGAPVAAAAVAAVAEATPPAKAKREAAAQPLCFPQGRAFVHSVLFHANETNIRCVIAEARAVAYVAVNGVNVPRATARLSVF